MALQLIPGYNFGNTEQVTSAKLALLVSAAGTTGTADITQGGTGASTAATARTNLGLGDSSTRAVGTTAGTVCAGDDARLSNARQCDNTFQNPATARANLAIGSMALRNVYISTSAPSGGADGDVWLQYV